MSATFKLKTLDWTRHTKIRAERIQTTPIQSVRVRHEDGSTETFPVDTEHMTVTVDGDRVIRHLRADTRFEEIPHD